MISLPEDVTELVFDGGTQGPGTGYCVNRR